MHCVDCHYLEEKIQNISDPKLAKLKHVGLKCSIISPGFNWKLVYEYGRRIRIVWRNQQAQRLNR
jgi:hypothetical protein